MVNRVASVSVSVSLVSSETLIPFFLSLFVSFSFCQQSIAIFVQSCRCRAFTIGLVWLTLWRKTVGLPLYSLLATIARSHPSLERPSTGPFLRFELHRLQILVHSSSSVCVEIDERRSIGFGLSVSIKKKQKQSRQNLPRRTLRNRLRAARVSAHK